VRTKLAKAVIASFYDFVCDIGKCAHLAPQELRSRVRAIHGDERYRAARSERKGAIIVTAHLG
jgi:lauroyl/myristoyl acyltransferase